MFLDASPKGGTYLDCGLVYGLMAVRMSGVRFYRHEILAMSNSALETKGLGFSSRADTFFLPTHARVRAAWLHSKAD